MAAMDTGLWEQSCNGTSVAHGLHMNLACDKIPNMSAVGTFAHFDHLLLPSLGVWAIHSLLPFPLPWSSMLHEATTLFGRSGMAKADCAPHSARTPRPTA
eukprot:6047403-Prymnesium_polylepis.1